MENYKQLIIGELRKGSRSSLNLATDLSSNCKTRFVRNRSLIDHLMLK